MATKPWALILCQFNDVAIPQYPISAFTTFMASGFGGLNDYWNDVSYGQINLAGSTVLGWWTMQYSFLQDGGRDRTDFYAEARRLAAVNNVDLSKYYGVIAFMNANVDGGNKGGTDMAASMGGTWGQSKWLWCGKCQAMSYAGFQVGRCPAGGTHDQSRSANYSLALNQSAGEPSQDNWRWCKKCQGLNYGGNPPGPCSAKGVHDNSESGDYALRIGKFGQWQNQWNWCKKCQMLVYGGGSPSPCSGGEVHDTSASYDYSIVQYWSDLNVTNIAHETGHGFGLQHSWLTDPEREYGDKWDIMSAMSVLSFSESTFPPAGPGLNAANFDFLGLLSDTFTWKGPPPGLAGEQIQLEPLNNYARGSFGFLAAKMPKEDRIYYVEYRQVSGWDRAYPRQAVFINEVRTWQWCQKCQELTAVASGIPGSCTAGGIHDHTGSDDYILLRNAPGDLQAQGGWEWCNKCQALTYAGSESLGECWAGGEHSHDGSGSYTLVHDTDYGTSSQPNWRWCAKCQALHYVGGPSIGPCRVGGNHTVESFDYKLLIHTRNSFLLGDAAGVCDWQPGKVFVAKDTHMGVIIHGFGTTAGVPTATVTIGDVQSTWRWCSKCQGLAFAGFSGGYCPATGVHEHAGSADYSLLHDVSLANGQNNWRWCSKCQGLSYSGITLGRCPAGGTHNNTGFDFVLMRDVAMVDAQDNWRWCSRCQGLFYAGFSQGVCPVDGGPHATAGDNYSLINV